MLLFFVLFIFFILHVQFLVRNIVFGTDEVSYFYFNANYLFDKDIAMRSLLFSLACAVCFAVGYLYCYRRPEPAAPSAPEFDLDNSKVELTVLNIAGMVQVINALWQIGSSGFNYQIMAEARMDFGFVFELRVFYLILLAHVLMNVPLSRVLKERSLRPALWVFAGYLLVTILGQARSVLFEITAVIMFAQIMWAGDKIRFKYVLFVFGALLVPNLIVLGRLEAIDDIGVLIGGIFSFEYSILFNNMLGSVINSGPGSGDALSFIPSLVLIIPSPIRALFGLTVLKSDYYGEVALDSGATNGGFSLLAEMFSNFGWYAPLLFGLLGMLIGRMNGKASGVGRVSIYNAAAPLLYVAFVLAFRNDFGVLIKYAVQLFIIAGILNVALPTKLGK